MSRQALHTWRHSQFQHTCSSSTETSTALPQHILPLCNKRVLPHMMSAIRTSMCLLVKIVLRWRRAGHMSLHKMQAVTSGLDH